MKHPIYFTATQCVPTFVKEIVDVRAVELEAVTFDCQFSGTPTPGKFYISLNLLIIIITSSPIPLPPGTIIVKLYSCIILTPMFLTVP
jgi:hypothetical protein